MQHIIKSFKLGRALWLLTFALLLTSLWWACKDRVNPVDVTEDLKQPPQPNIQAKAETKRGLVAEPENSAQTKQVSTNGSGQLQVMQRPDWTLNSILLEELSRLKIAVESGDDEAAYVLGMNLKACYFVPEDESGLAARLQEAYQFNDDGVSVTNITARYEFCAGVDKQLRRQFYDYLVMAASKGLVAAQEAIATITPEQYMQAAGYDEIGRADYVARRSDFVKKQVNYLESAAQHGSMTALINLSRLHHAQKIGVDGRLKAYAINQIILQLTDDNELYNRYSWFQEQAQTVLTPEDIERTIKISEQWLKIIASNGTLYLNDH